MADPKRLAEQCVHSGLLYLAESLQYYWPARGEVAENNIALHLARSFAEKGFQMWAEIPLHGENRRLDFLAYSYTDKITIALEFKKSIETPQGNQEDLKRLVDIHADGLCHHHGIGDAEHKMYGVVTLLSATEFADWWHDPKACGYMPPDGRSAPEYIRIGKALEVADFRWVGPLVEHMRSVDAKLELKWRFLRAAYALYDEHGIGKLAEVLN